MDYFLGMYEGFRGHMVTAHSTDWMGRILHLTWFTEITSFGLLWSFSTLAGLLCCFGREVGTTQPIISCWYLLLKSTSCTLKVLPRGKYRWKKHSVFLLVYLLICVNLSLYIQQVLAPPPQCQQQCLLYQMFLLQLDWKVYKILFTT